MPTKTDPVVTLGPDGTATRSGTAGRTDDDARAVPTPPWPVRVPPADWHDRYCAVRAELLLLASAVLRLPGEGVAVPEAMADRCERILMRAEG